MRVQVCMHTRATMQHTAKSLPSFPAQVGLDTKECGQTRGLSSPPPGDVAKSPESPALSPGLFS